MALGPASPESLIRRFVSVTSTLSSQLQRGLPGVNLDPIQVIVMACLTRRISQCGEINGVRYWKHGFGAMLRDAKRPPETPGVVDVDIEFGAWDRQTSYFFHADSIREFASSLELPEPSDMQVEEACIQLVRSGLLEGTWSFQPQLADPVREDERGFREKLESLGRVLQSLRPETDKPFFE